MFAVDYLFQTIVHAEPAMLWDDWVTYHSCVILVLLCCERGASAPETVGAGTWRVLGLGGGLMCGNRCVKGSVWGSL